MPLALLPLLPGLAAAPPQALNANNEFPLACRCCSVISPAQLTGTLPPDIFVRRPNLLGLVLSGNRLHGTLPSLYGRSQVGPGGGCERAAAVLSMPVCELTRGALGCTCVAGSTLLGLGVQGTPLELVRLHCSGHTISKCCMVPVPAAGRPSSNHRHALPAMQAWGYCRERCCARHAGRTALGSAACGTWGAAAPSCSSGRQPPAAAATRPLSAASCSAAAQREPAARTVADRSRQQQHE